MASLDKELIEKKLLQLGETLQELLTFRKFTLKELKDSTALFWSVEHGLQLVIQQMIDIGSHLLVSQNLNNIDDYSDVGRKLGKHGMVSKELSDKLVLIIKFRNLLVHEYVKIETEQVFEILQKHLEDVKQFIEAIKNYLRKK